MNVVRGYVKGECCERLCEILFIYFVKHKGLIISIHAIIKTRQRDGAVLLARPDQMTRRTCFR